MNIEKKRKVPPALKQLLALDVYLSDLFVKSAEKLLPFRQLQVHYKLLELSCHGIPWFAAVLATVWLFKAKSLYQIQVNLFIGLLLDVCFVAIIKAAVRRRRPAVNDDPLTFGPDKYSFPSGHTSRATLIVFLLMNVWPIAILYYPSLLVWCISVSLSRLLMRRHHILDILAGVILGLAEGILMSLIFLEYETCVTLLSWISGEKFDGEE